MNPKQLRDQAEDLFVKRTPLMQLWQEIAEQFYVERADFTYKRTLGQDFAAHLSSSFPLLCRRELGDTITTMLRPSNKRWAHIRPKDPDRRTHAARMWLERAAIVQHTAMYDRVAQLERAAKAADHDFASFGQAPMSVQLAPSRDHLIYQDWHLRDVAWREDELGQIDFVTRRWKPGAADLVRRFPRAKFNQNIIRKADKTPFAECNILHVVCKAPYADFDAKGRTWFSMFYDCENDEPFEQVALWHRIYVIPRWQTVAGSQYAFSPATVAALPEGRLLQAMTLTLLEAGEKAVNPPLVAQKDVVKSDMQQYPGGVTWVDAEYDERLGDALRAMNIDVKGLPIGLEMVKDSREVLRACFFLNKIKAFNPNTDPNMTAFQAGQIVQEYIRGALPLFEPMEPEYNGLLCEETFDILYRNGAFGSPQDMPKELRNAEVEFHFESPLHDVIDQQKGTKFLEFKQIVAEAVALDPSCADLPDATVILRDVAAGIGVPAQWIRSESGAAERQQAREAAQQQAQLLEAMQQSSEVARNLGTARKDAATAEAV